MKLRSLFLGFVVGGVAAGIATLLSAPTSGKEARKNIMENSLEWKSQLADLNSTVLQLKETVLSASKEGKESLLTFVQDLKLLISDWKQDIQPHQIRLKEELDSIQSAVSELETQLKTDTK
ncbi:YtxH domain-containing protein [Cytobacillus sp. FJAT-54145]|uniref:YtxH domain-containing protein n=1 Tax=Cytobacillus spartinae TaxID=3299023 RepID=A0ABW6KBZ3_9BACI